MFAFSTVQIPCGEPLIITDADLLIVCDRNWIVPVLFTVDTVHEIHSCRKIKDYFILVHLK